MPLYTYKCRICEHTFEHLQSAGVRDIASCPKCMCVSDIKPSPVHFTFGWTLSDESRHVKGAKDYFVKNV